jgi:hypothetical protein
MTETVNPLLMDAIREILPDAGIMVGILCVSSRINERYIYQ